MKDVLATPNDQHTASGAPGHQYTQQKVDYVMDIRLDESNNKIYGDEKITYYNNSKDVLEYLQQNEELFVDKIDKACSEAPYEYGSCGVDEYDGMNERGDSECRYDIVGKNYGGHL